MKQDDFKNQKSGLEEIYINHNLLYNKNHQLKFLPKFHPELNMIERVWSRMKWYVRKHADGSLETLKRLMKSGLSEDNLPLSLIRKYCRLLTAYYIAYNEGKDIIQADAWIKKHRSHRGHSELMDNRLEQLYYPYGREEEVIDIDNDDHIITADDIEYINDGTVDDDLDVWMEMLKDYHENGRII